MDDVVFGGSSHSLVAWLVEDMIKEFEMSMMGELQLSRASNQVGEGGKEFASWFSDADFCVVSIGNRLRILASFWDLRSFLGLLANSLV
jgi:hypothetical protein